MYVSHTLEVISAFLHTKFLELFDIHYIQFPFSHSLLDHFQSSSTPIVNGGHYFSVAVFLNLNLLTEIDTVGFYFLIETRSAIGL